MSDSGAKRLYRGRASAAHGDEGLFLTGRSTNLGPEQLPDLLGRRLGDGKWRWGHSKLRGKEASGYWSQLPPALPQ